MYLHWHNKLTVTVCMYAMRLSRGIVAGIGQWTTNHRHYWAIDWRSDEASEASHSLAHAYTSTTRYIRARILPTDNQWLRWATMDW